jgi:hypothetical protein
MKAFYSTVLLFPLLFLSFFLTAQMPGGGGARPGGGGQNMNMGHFYGKVIDSATNKPIYAASVQLIQNKLDTTTKKRKDVVVSGCLQLKKVNSVWKTWPLWHPIN